MLYAEKITIIMVKKEIIFEKCQYEWITDNRLKIQYRVKDNIKNIDVYHRNVFLLAQTTNVIIEDIL